MVENPEIKIIECMKRSRKMMKGVKFKYFKLQFSFIGWWIFSIFTLGIAALWVNPYVMLANTNFYEEIKNRIITKYPTTEWIKAYDHTRALKWSWKKHESKFKQDIMGNWIPK